MTQTQPAVDATTLRRLPAFLFTTVVLLIGSYTFLSYWEYSRTYYAGPHEWSDLLAGRGMAPAQYRLGVLWIAALLARLSRNHIPLRAGLALLDGVFLTAGFASLLAVLRRTARIAGASGQWLLLLIAISIFDYYLFWTFWYHKPETIATFACLAVSLLLFSGSSGLPKWAAAAGLVLVAAYAATVRADAAFAFHAGVLLVLPLRSSVELPLGRPAQAVASLLSISVVLGIEFYIKNVLYPHAPFSDPLLQLGNNLRAPENLFCVLFALCPYLATAWLTMRDWRVLKAWEQGLVAGSLIDFALFLIVGKSEEVRIFLPFAMTVLVVSAPRLYRHFVQGDALVVSSR